MIIETKKWKRIGAFIITFSCVSAYWTTPEINMEDIPQIPSLLREEGEDTTVLLTINKCFFPKNYCHIQRLGEVLTPNVKGVCLVVWDIPDAPQREKMSPCTEVSALRLWSRFPNPEILSWVKIMFPSVSKLEIYVSGLPIRSHSFPEEQIKEMQMESVIQLVLTREQARVCFNFENLKLFPRVTTLEFKENLSIALPPEDRAKDLVFSSVEVLSLHIDTDMDEVCLNELPRMFPSLRRLRVGAGIFEKLRQRDMHTCCFSTLKRLDIRAKSLDGLPKQIIFDESMTSVFPSLEEITVYGSAAIKVKLPPSADSIKGLAEMKSLITCLWNMECPPGSLERLFPNLEFIGLVGRELKRFSEGEEFFGHPHLKILTIAENSGLDSVIPKTSWYEKFGSFFGVDRLVHSIGARLGPYTIRRAPPAGGLNFPKLEFLDMRRCFNRRLPRNFLSGCPKIKALAVSFDVLHGTNTVGWWDFLKALPDLEEVRIELLPYQDYSDYSYPVRSVQQFTGSTLDIITADLLKTLAEVKKGWKAPPELTLLRRNGEFPINHDRYLESGVIVQALDFGSLDCGLKRHPSCGTFHDQMNDWSATLLSF